MADTTAPSLTSLSLPATIYLKGDNRAVTLTVRATDGCDGVQAAQIWLNDTVGQVGADGQIWVSDTIYFDDAVDSFGDGLSSLELTLSSRTDPGAYSIQSVYLIDKAGNERTYTIVDLKALGVRTSFTVSSSTPPAPQPPDAVTTTTSTTLSDDALNLTAGDAASVMLIGNASDNVIIGNTGQNVIQGEAGNDTLNGGLGNDSLTGGTGKGAFVFTTKLGTSKTDRTINFDKVTDFSVKDDSVYLDNAIFKKLGSGSPTKPKMLNKKLFVVGDKAKDKDDYVVYNKKTGVLSYDADGSGKGQAIEFAQLKKGLVLKYDDLFVI
jgi:Ca2+-binding RTX toxin-like protein